MHHIFARKKSKITLNFSPHERTGGAIIVLSSMILKLESKVVCDEDIWVVWVKKTKNKA